MLESSIYTAPASYAQARIWLDERVRFDPDKPVVAIYNMPFLYRLYPNNTLSIKQLRHTLQLIITKHVSLRTSLIFDTEKNLLMQRIIDMNNHNKQLFTFVESPFETDEQLTDIINDEKWNSQLFDLAEGLVFRCHLVFHKQISTNDLLSDKDVIIFNFHHALFDYPSMNVFLHDLHQAYTVGQLTTEEDSALRYLDYSVFEQEMPMSGASMFWLDILHDCNLDRSLPLPYDRYRLVDEHRTGRGTSVSFDFDADLSHHFLAYASSKNVTPEQLALACYYLFLFKLTNGEKDFCIGMDVDNRYRNELKLVIGLFENLIPLRCQLEPLRSVHQLVKQVQEIITSSLEYSYYPLQRILAQHPNTSQPAFLDTIFVFHSDGNQNIENEVLIGDSQLQRMSMSSKASEHEIVSKFDFALAIQHSRSSNEFSCIIDASLDLFNNETVDTIAQRFHSILRQLFKVTDVEIDRPIYELSLILPDERLLMQSMNNTEVLFPPVSCIHHEFVSRVMKYPQKLAVELDDQSLTYAELLHLVQILSSDLLQKQRVTVGEIVCLCVERSLSMVIGILAVEVVGGVYCPLSPRDPDHRLHALVEQIQSRLVLVHWFTQTKFKNDIITFDIDLVLNKTDINHSIFVDELSSPMITSESIAYIIFTSGSTGTPKAVQIRHRSFLGCIYSLNYIDLFNYNDIVVQMANCSYDVHMQEIVGALLVGSSVVMLHPLGNMDFDYLFEVLHKKQVSYMQSVPAYLNDFMNFLVERKHSKLSSMRIIDVGGDISTTQLFEQLYARVLDVGRAVHTYGPAETTVDGAYHIVDMSVDKTQIPIGQPHPNYQNLILNEFLQNVIINEEGELCVGGVGVFAGYLGRDDLTEKALVDIEGEIYYRTGDLVRMDHNGLLYYLGRKDHQIKLHGQRIELGEIERCLLNTSISSCVVMKWGDDHLVAYVQSSDVNEEQLREHCQSHLPPHMIPSIFMILEKLPLNANGKIDRKLLPTPQFSTIASADHTELSLMTPLEQRLRRIFSEAFHNESPDVTMSFGRMGGTSLDAIRAIWLIRREICTEIDAGLLFANPSIRQLAHAIEPLLSVQVDSSARTTTSLSKEEGERLMPSLCIELIGILLLMSQWLFPIWSAYYFHSIFALISIPVFHLLSYVVCQRLMFPTKEIESETNQLYSWSYYRWWFLNSMWSINNSYWLKHLVGTPFYNAYLRLCGAKIDRHSHIYTTLIDTPWLLEVGESTFIGDEVVLSSLFYQDQTYELHRIQIGSHCSINIRSVIYGNVILEDHVYAEPMSAITGHIAPSNDNTSIENRSFSFSQTIYQFMCLLCLLFIQGLLIFFIYLVYHSWLTLFLPLSISLALVWLIWIVISLFTVTLLLKFIVGSVTSGHHPLNSYYYLHKLWLRQLIVTSFHYSLDFVPSYNVLSSIIFRWLGAHIGEDVRFAELQQILYFPPNLLHIERGATTFGGANLASFEMTKEGLCYVDKIHLGSGTNLTNWCTIMPGTRLSPEIIVGSLTLVTRNSVSDRFNGVLLGIPARQMPFAIPDTTSAVNDLSSSDSRFTQTWLLVCLSFFISKCFLITVYSSLSAVFALSIHVIFVCTLYHYSISSRRKRSHFRFSEVITGSQHSLHTLISDFFIFFGPYLSGTQLLVYFFRILGAQIGCDVIISDITCLTDPHLVSMGDHVRLHRNAYIQCHTFEQRLLKLAPVTVNQSSVLMSSTLVLSGSSLEGHNRISPLTLVMKNDQLPFSTNWSGVPAQRTT